MEENHHSKKRTRWWVLSALSFTIMGLFTFILRPRPPSLAAIDASSRHSPQRPAPPAPPAIQSSNQDSFQGSNRASFRTSDQTMPPLTQELPLVAPRSRSPVNLPTKRTPLRAFSSVVSSDSEGPPATSLLATPQAPLPRNHNYAHSRLSILGLLWSQQSSQQLYQNQTPPVAIGTGVNFLIWNDQSGVEGTLNFTVLGTNAAARQSSSTNAEIRYHYRFSKPLPMRFARELQISAFAGIEMHRNSSDLFANQYDLLKIGTQMTFPILENWSSGGEFVYGAAADLSPKQEVSGFLTYFPSMQWSMKCGYRIHFFEARTASSSPGGLLPYREGYTEGFSAIEYYF